MSLRTGGPVGTATTAIVNPNNLKIEGFYCTDAYDNSQTVLLTQDIRELLPQGFVIDDHEVLAAPDELVRLQKILRINFQPIGKPVFTTDKQKVGKVVDFAAESTTFYIQKLYVGQSLLKSFSSSQLSIDRSQIVEITKHKIVIHELLKPAKGAVPAAAPTA